MFNYIGKQTCKDTWGGVYLIFNAHTLYIIEACLLAPISVLHGIITYLSNATQFTLWHNRSPTNRETSQVDLLSFPRCFATIFLALWNRDLQRHNCDSWVSFVLRFHEETSFSYMYFLRSVWIIKYGKSERMYLNITNTHDAHIDGLVRKYCMSTFSVFEKNGFQHVIVDKIQRYSMKKNIIFDKFIK